MGCIALKFVKYTRDNYRNTPGLRIVPVVDWARTNKVNNIFEVLDGIAKELEEQFDSLDQMYDYLQELPKRVQEFLLARGINAKGEQLEWQTEIAAVKRVKQALLEGTINLSPRLAASFPDWEADRDELNPNNLMAKKSAKDNSFDPSRIEIPAWKGDKTLRTPEDDDDLDLEL